MAGGEFFTHEIGHLLTGGGKPPEKEKRASGQEETAGDLLKDPILTIPEITSERLTFARKAINDALSEIGRAHKAQLSKYNIQLKPVDFYLAIAVKESRLNPSLSSSSSIIGGSSGTGLFQILIGANNSSQTLDEIKNKFNITINGREIFYNSRDTTKAALAAKKNAMAAILYFHLCRDIVLKEKINLPDQDQDKAAFMSYFFGPSDVKRLWEALQSADFTDFQKKIAQKLKEKFPEQINIPENGREIQHDKTYNRKIQSYFRDRKPLTGKIQIGNTEFDAEKLAVALRYPEVIASLAYGEPQQEEKQEKSKDQEFETITQTRTLYKITTALKQKYGLTENVNGLVEKVLNFNYENNNPDFANIPRDQATGSLRVGQKIFLPPKEYLTKPVATTSPKDEPVAKKSPENLPEVLRKEKIKENRKLYSIAMDILFKEIPNLKQKTNNDTIMKIIGIIIDFNYQIKNPALSSVNKEDPDRIGKINGLIDAEISIPSLNYIKAKLTAPIPKEIPLPEASSLPGEGTEFIIFLKPYNNITARLFTMASTILGKKDYFKDLKLNDYERSLALIKIIVSYNKSISNSDFNGISTENFKVKMRPGMKVYFPTEEYIENEIKKLTAPKRPGKPVDTRDLSEIEIGPGQMVYAYDSDGKKAEKAKEPLFKPGETLEPLEIKIPEGHNPSSGIAMKKGKKIEVPLEDMKKEDVKKIVLHATVGKIYPGNRLYKHHYAHFLVKQDGTVEQITDTGKRSKHAGRAVSDGDDQISYHSIGIEIETLSNEGLFREQIISLLPQGTPVTYYSRRDKKKQNPLLAVEVPPSPQNLSRAEKTLEAYNRYTEEQYESLRKLLKKLGQDFPHLKKGDVTSHLQVAVEGKLSGRKQDPHNLDPTKLDDLPNLFEQVNLDIARGDVRANLARIEAERTGKVLDTVWLVQKTISVPVFTESKDKKGKTIRKKTGTRKETIYVAANRKTTNAKLYYRVTQVQVNDTIQNHYSPTGHFGNRPDLYEGLKFSQKICEAKHLCVPETGYIPPDSSSGEEDLENGD